MPIHDPNLLTMTDLLVQITEWSLRNFDHKQASDLGVVEEIGEATHGILKRFQGIRGFHDDAHYKAHMLDAFGDLGVYLLNYAGTNGLLVSDYEQVVLPTGCTDRRCISQLLMGVSLLLEFADNEGVMLNLDQPLEKDQLRAILQKLWHWSATWAHYHGFNLREVTSTTWIKVRARDWAKNRTHAHIVAEQGGNEVPTPAAPGTIDTNGDVGSVPVEPETIPLVDEPNAPAELGALPEL